MTYYYLSALCLTIGFGLGAVSTAMFCVYKFERITEHRAWQLRQQLCHRN